MGNALEPSLELREQVIALYGAMSSGDADSVESFYSHEVGSVFIGTDAREFWTDSRQHNADVRHFFDGSHGTSIWSAGEVLAFVDDVIGWSVDRPVVRFSDGSALQIRVTLIWRNENGRWRVVHSHASVGGDSES